MMYEYPAEALDEINRLRVENKVREVDELAENIWAAWTAGKVVDALGIGAVCQVAFVSSTDAHRKGSDDIYAKAQLWRARACIAAVRTGEMNTMAILMVPMAFAANAHGHYDSAIAIMHEMGHLIDEFERQEGARRLACERDGVEYRRVPGVSLPVLRRALHEKMGYLLWRNGAYTASLAAYNDARSHATQNTRDWIRIDGGNLLAQLGVEESTNGAFDISEASSSFQSLADAARKGVWLDVEGPLRRNAEALADRRVSTVQDLEPIEIE